MKKPLYLIYIPGLGDSNGANGQRKAVALWPKFGVEAELFHMKWADKEPWEPKFKRLLARIDELTSEGKDVALIAASAGASAAVNAFAARKDTVLGCGLIAGKVNRPNFIGQRFRVENPAFVQSAEACQDALKTLNQQDRKRILNRYALADETVYKPDSRISGAKNRIVPSVGHFVTIATQLTLGIPSFIKFFKKLQLTDK